MRLRNKLIVGTAIVGAAAGGIGFATAATAGGGDDSHNVTGSGADRATAAALKATGGGTANSVELDNENGATWEVEVTKPSGKTVDVRLDDAFKVVVIEGDSEGADTDDAGE
jgi:uncharacterized membrane protein YkoI